MQATFSKPTILLSFPRDETKGVVENSLKFERETAVP